MTAPPQPSASRAGQTLWVATMLLAICFRGRLLTAQRLLLGPAPLTHSRRFEVAWEQGGNPRALSGAALRSIFRTLKGPKDHLHQPDGAHPGSSERRRPLSADIQELTAALHCEDPARAAIAALLAFHGLRPGQLHRLQLTDVRDGRLHLEHGSVLLAEPVRQRLGAWLDHRNRRWPNSAKPHLFVNCRTVSRTQAVGTRWTNYTLGIPARDIRVDRILDEVHATGGDVRRLCDLFGLSVGAAIRYLEQRTCPATP